MLTPIELHNTQLKTGRGYSKKEMDDFLEDVFESYETLYKENIELKEKLTKLSEGIQYYKSMETTLQKALVLAEKTSKETIEAAGEKAKLIEQEAKLKADTIISQHQLQCEQIKQNCISLVQQYNQFKMQFKQVAAKQIELLEDEMFNIYDAEFVKNINNTFTHIPQAETVETVNQETSQQAVSPVISDEEVKNESTSTTKEVIAEKTESDVLKRDTIEIPMPDLSVFDMEDEDTEQDENEVIEKIEESFGFSSPENNSLDNLLKDLRKDFAEKAELTSDDEIKFEFLDNDEL